ncbi:MAG TPA: thiol:disulfide interchange protein DsbA/DsbL [Burkholderiales bacterium]|nr:thiol:disulfide interchange protein DsbA/DsbL [Burkholderiales bacterium]
MDFRPLSVLPGLLLALAVSAQGAPSEGVDYVEVKPPQSVDSPNKIEVIEFFWYRCPHCYALEPELESWVKRLPRDVQFRRVPGILNEEWAVDARIFYALEAIGEVDRLHRSLFDAIHQQGGVRLHGDAFAKWVADWLAKQKVDMAKYDAALHSFTVESKLRRAAQMARSYGLDGVPSLTVQGRYLVVASTSQKAMLDTTDFLIGESRKKLAKAKP